MIFAMFQCLVKNCVESFVALIQQAGELCVQRLVVAILAHDHAGKDEHGGEQQAHRQSILLREVIDFIDRQHAPLPLHWSAEVRRQFRIHITQVVFAIEFIRCAQQACHALFMRLDAVFRSVLRGLVPQQHIRERAAIFEQRLIALRALFRRLRQDSFVK
jgi:hypothetical protein